ncbi:phosphoheptose isomerase [Rhodovulum sulfidophilum]|uniref:Phosphoheptose isomerase n=1 Tax=Rhodovulum sulfidophilum TaxID=35806 RepID=A0A0D6B746_RHOSU|nr:phosphoheptose isomerase [Rhodovulum sulfidophilum]
MGDSYHNSGNNYGHMGPVNIGRQSFELNQPTREEILRKIPRHGILRIEIVGSGRAQSMGLDVVRFLGQNGYSFPEPTFIGMLVPPPSGPICFEGGALTIAADA